MAAVDVAEPAGLSEADIARFDEDGVVCIRGAFAEWVEPLRNEIEKILERPRASAVNHAERQGGVFFHDTDLWRDTDVIRRVALSSRASSMVRQLVGTDRLNFYGDHLLIKEPGSPTARTPWHQDESYMRVGGWQLVTVWIALDRVTAETGALQFVVGSHRWGKTYRPVRFSGGEAFAHDRFSETVPDIDADPERYRTTQFDLGPGDCTIHHIRTLHAGGGNRSLTTRRRALVLRYAGDDVRYVEPNKAATWSRGAEGKTGARLDPEEFPVAT
jgi:ectoine hydroxylase-related dioxygenase (phytanoyl-CoA dioxygenase family)